jgi:hypothetical protein
MKKSNYIGNDIGLCMLIAHFRFLSLIKGLFLVLIFFILLKSEVKAQDNYIDETGAIPFVYDEIPVLVIVEGYKSFYVDVIYTNNELLYVNIQDLFKTLKIPYTVGSKGNSISGFIENENRTYLIDYNTRQIKVANKTINPRNGLVNEMGSLYMESSLFSEAFGIRLTFNYRSLSLILKSNFELPIIKQARIEKLRNNILKLKGEETVDTVLQRYYHLFKFGTMDWSVASFQKRKGLTDNRFGLSLGAELLNGEGDISVLYYDRQKFDNRQLQYLWRWVDNDKSIIKQAQVGKISNQTISYINAPVVGAVIRNSPTTVRKASGYYTINEFTEPNWTIELYINNVMVDYTKADASGLFTFKVPIVYGYTTLKLIFYGTMGEQRTEERTMNLPYTIMPTGEFEYGLALGLVQDISTSRFGRGEFNYGVNRFLTVGGGLEYLSSIANGTTIPFAKATLQPNNKLSLNGEYAHGVKTRGLLDYYFWKDALLEFDYTKYVDGQLATRFNAPEERKAKLSLPFRYKKSNGFVKFDYAQFVYKAFIFNQADMILSSYFKQFSANSTVQLNWIKQKTAYVTSDLALSCRLNNGFTIRPSARYNATENNLMSYKAAIEKSIPRGNVTATYERNILSNDNFFSLNIKFDLDYARTNITTTHSNGNFTMAESAQGSLAFGSGNNYTHKSNNSSVSKGGLSIYPFLDLNQNGIFDDGEHMVKIDAIRLFGGNAIFSKNDSIVRISDLNAFTNYIMEFADKDLENIAWRFKNKRYQVLIDPNQFKRIDIPVIPVGEVSGMVYFNNDKLSKGIGRILVKYYKKNDSKAGAETLSESDGFVYYLGLEPGEYVARIDSAQLSNLDLFSDPSQISFSIKTLEQGDIVGGIDFVLHAKHVEMLKKQIVVQETTMEVQANDDTISSTPFVPVLKMDQENIQPTVIQQNSSSAPLPYLTDEVSIVMDSLVFVPGDTLYKVQLLALHVPIRVKGYFLRLLTAVPGLTIEELEGEDGLYHYSTGSFRGIVQAREFLQLIKQSGWNDCFIAIYKVIRWDEPIYRLKRITKP